MCLIIDKRYHRKNIFGKYKALVAKEDITVAKELCYEDGNYITPYQHYLIDFDNGYTTLNAKFRVYKDEVYEGIHAYYHLPLNRIQYYAVIPKGTKYYIGYYDDVVSEKLIIFKNKNYYNVR